MSPGTGGRSVQQEALMTRSRRDFLKLGGIAAAATAMPAPAC